MFPMCDYENDSQLRFDDGLVMVMGCEWLRMGRRVSV